MADMKDIVKLAVDGYKGRVEKYSVEQSQDTLRQALMFLTHRMLLPLLSKHSILTRCRLIR